ncbi:hypothetical protein [Arthrobacter sp. G119Y2]
MPRSALNRAGRLHFRSPALVSPVACNDDADRGDANGFDGANVAT